MRELSEVCEPWSTTGFHDLLASRPQVRRDAAPFAVGKGQGVRHLGSHAGEDRRIGFLEEVLEEVRDFRFEGGDAPLDALNLELDRGVHRQTR